MSLQRLVDSGASRKMDPVPGFPHRLFELESEAGQAVQYKVPPSNVLSKLLVTENVKVLSEADLNICRGVDLNYPISGGYKVFEHDGKWYKLTLWSRMHVASVRNIPTNNQKQIEALMSCFPGCKTFRRREKKADGLRMDFYYSSDKPAPQQEYASIKFGGDGMFERMVTILYSAIGGGHKPSFYSRHRDETKKRETGDQRPHGDEGVPSPSREAVSPGSREHGKTATPTDPIKASAKKEGGRAKNSQNRPPRVQEGLINPQKKKPTPNNTTPTPTRVPKSSHPVKVPRPVEGHNGEFSKKPSTIHQQESEASSEEGHNGDLPLPKSSSNLQQLSEEPTESESGEEGEPEDQSVSNPPAEAVDDPPDGECNPLELERSEQQ